VLTHKAGNIEVDKNDARMAAILAETDKLKKELTAEGQAARRRAGKIAELIKSLDECRSAIDTVSGMIGVDFGMAVSFIAPFEEQYAKMTGQLDAGRRRRQQADRSRDRQEAGRSQRRDERHDRHVADHPGAVAGLAFMTVMTTRKSIGDIAGATEKLSKGDNTIDLEKMTRGDELGAIVRSLKVFRDNQLHLEQMRAEQEKNAALTADERRAKEEPPPPPPARTPWWCRRLAEAWSSWPRAT
jgi:methyl-accepting chemotaxis protein